MQWIKCSEKLPDHDDLVLVYNYRDGIHCGYFEKEKESKWCDGWFVYYEWAPHEITSHWMELPEQPKE